MYTTVNNKSIRQQPF